MPILSLLLLIIILPVALAGLSLAPWVPTRQKDLPRIKRLAQLKANQKFYELGSGNGRVSCYIARKNPQAQIIGIELALSLWIWAKAKTWWKSSVNLTLKLGSLFNQDLSSADVVYIFGMPKKLKAKLKTKLEQELPPQAKVLSYVFPISGWEPSKIDQPDKKQQRIYIYEMSSIITPKTAKKPPTIQSRITT